MRWATSAQRAAPLAALTTGLAAEPAMFRADARHGGVYEAAGVAVLHGAKWTFRTVADSGRLRGCSTADWPIEDAWPALAPAGSA